MENHEATGRLTNEDLARSAKELPLKVIRRLGHHLHRSLNAGGNWEILAEELGYEYEDIKRLNATANIRQEVTPGELLLRDWVDQPSSGHTLFVLHNALCKIDRYDCAEYMSKEVYNNVILMDLMICVKDEALIGSTKHLTVRTRSNSTLLASLQNILTQPVQTNYNLLDLGASWTRTLAKEYKGRQLLIQNTTMIGAMAVDQDPTIDSSSMGDWIQQDMVPHLQRAQQPNLGTSHTRHQAQLNPEPGQSVSWQNASFGSHTQAHIQSTRRKIPVDNVDQYLGSGSLNERTASITPGVNVLRKQTHNQRNENSVPIHGFPSQRNSHCTSCQCQELKPNDLNIADSNYHAGRISEGAQNCHSMNICEKDHKIENIPRTHRAEGACRLERKPQQMKNVSPYAANATVAESGVSMGDQQSEVSKGDNPFLLNEEMMTDSEYNGGDNTDGPCLGHNDSASEYKDPDHVEIKQTLISGGELTDDTEYHDPNSEYNDPDKVENFKQKLTGRDGAVCDSSRNSSLTFLKQNSALEDDVSIVSCELTASSDSDKEFVSMKLDSMEDMDNDCHIIGTFNTQMNYIECTHTSQTQLFKENDEDDPFYEKQRQVNMPLQTGDTHPKVRFDLTQSDRVLSSMESNRFADRNHQNTKNMPMVNNGAYGHQSGSHQYPYIDFNDFPQNSPKHTRAALQSTAQDCDTLLKVTPTNQKNTLRMDETGMREEHFVNKKLDTSCEQIGSSGCRYESLQRHISCPADFRLYETSDISVPTIADVFSPVRDDPREFRFEGMQHEGSADQEIICDENMSRGNVIKRHSLPALTTDTSTNMGTKYRHTYTQGQNSEIFGLQFSECSSLDSMEENDNVNIPPPLPHRVSKVTSHPYKVVVGERSTKLSLDGMLANDRLFTLYNNKFRGELAWSPLETEYTVERTMRDLVYQDGFYILWYNRTKRNLMITISNMGKSVHIRVRSKVLNNHLHFYIMPGLLFNDVRELVHSYMEQGLVLNSSRTGTRQAGERRLWMRCPVIVQYEKRPAVSV